MAVVDALGSHNLELRKNVTLDIIETDTLKGEALREELRVWRDKCGFCVMDAHDYYEVRKCEQQQLIQKQPIYCR